jgi:DNA repair protein RadC
MTLTIIVVAKLLDISIHDHNIISKAGAREPEMASVH